MFNWLDLIIPIAFPGLLVTGFSVWGAVKADNTVSRVLAIATAVVSAASVPVFYLVKSGVLHH